MLISGVRGQNSWRHGWRHREATVAQKTTSDNQGLETTCTHQLLQGAPDEVAAEVLSAGISGYLPVSRTGLA